MITKGDQVLGWQKMLAEAGFSPGPLDGVFGPRTTTATKAFQKANSLPPTGKVNAPTYEAMKARLGGRKLPEVSIKGFFGGLDNKLLIGSGVLIALYAFKAFSNKDKE